MNIHENVSLKPYNTFGLDVMAKYFIEIKQINDLKEIVKANKSDKLFILGGGSNMLLTQDINKIVIKLDLKGINIINEDNDYVYVEAEAGENWHEFVLWCIEHNYGGVENLSLIPGNVGTTPIQNIGAYGVEIKDVLHSCKALNMETLEIRDFTNAECEFDYRESVFKNALKNQYIILSATYKLTKQNHNLKVEYGAIKSQLDADNITAPSIRDISNAVISIRQSKLPDPKEIGNSGSFFKNPIVDRDTFERLHRVYPSMPHYVINEQEVKIPAGWLIETSGFKGYRLGDAGVHEKQALVLVNYGKAEGEQIKKLAETVQREVFNLFGISIHAEVNIF
ncbi:UDP-N-acetylmuramate dehydrogenase [Myroides odoratimimus]|uniref:UDP-N-acetylmuramate dehydrogenase n=1 Tax=Myroides odoratimimus TaxID=76832 RepID=UPI00103FAECA|nr:UDP-N-acetylmuramate dehydrogenase [Myroides odoratimimus]MDM1094445.1 UDP-N-acetylmuramate dehydrogenase [Myroides odoratimimus]MDM1443379.1 UDP-N-acetylmuramate dehydrogenase [Myroides odoratimimus]MDM1450052.1 UDP-N-acetylmuramate dehydrogenase [Myroides odoratimimus]MDM1452856.1 UDP-N-acetylmuramate dehydrogenase [Myroides odoratimimus]MDM1467726.1 UDP-N-acetylmuramate dehydrogenase [Myroides odoratimimus]